MKKIMVLICFICCNIGFAEDAPGLLQAALNKMEADSVYNYSYKKAITADEETKIISFDPSLEEGDQWQLLSINGNSPSKDELKAFYKEMSGMPDTDKDKKNISLTTDDMYDFKLLSENENNVTFQCKMKGKKNKKMMDKVICKISICKTDTSMQMLKMKLTESVSPMISVKLDEFNMEMNFQKMSDTGANLLQETKTKVKGKAMVFKEINQMIIEKYYDYKLVK